MSDHLEDRDDEAPKPNAIVLCIVAGFILIFGFILIMWRR